MAMMNKPIMGGNGGWFRGIRHRLSGLGLTLGLLASGALALSLPGCISGRVGGSTAPDVVIDELRQSNLDLQRQIAELNQKLEDRQAQIQTLNQQVQGAQAVAGVDVPRAVAIRFDRYSGGVDTNNDGRDDVLRLYVKPHDQQGRQIPVAGTASVQAVAIVPDKQPEQVAQRSYALQEWEASYRSGITGTHYTLELPLPEKMVEGIKELTVHVTVVDGATGAKLSHQAVLMIR